MSDNFAMEIITRLVMTVHLNHLIQVYSDLLDNEIILSSAYDAMLGEIWEENEKLKEELKDLKW